MPRSKYTAAEKLAILTEFKQSNLSLGNFAKHNKVATQTVKDWQVKYQSGGTEELSEAHHNKHYSKELKREAISDFLNGEGTYREIAIKYGLRSTTQLLNWVSRYNRDKQITASPFRKQVPIMSRKTTFKERIEVVEYVTRHKHSYAEAAEHFAVSYQQARSWVLKTKQAGYEALIDNRGHHKQLSELTDLEKANLRIRQLESELKDKELMEAFIKKIQEIQRRE